MMQLFERFLQPWNKWFNCGTLVKFEVPFGAQPAIAAAHALPPHIPKRVRGVEGFACLHRSLGATKAAKAATLLSIGVFSGHFVEPKATGTQGALGFRV